jgi:hypothetical protein
MDAEFQRRRWDGAHDPRAARSRSVEGEGSEVKAWEREHETE